MLRLLTALLRAIALAVPSAERGRWREEWLAEVHQIARERGTRTAARVATGAAADALALRRLVAARARALAATHGKGPMRLGISSSDVKLALRMLVRYPGLTAIGVLGMAVGIAIAAGAFAIIYTFVDPALPLPEGDRIVAIQNWDAAANTPERRILHDFVAWRDEMTTVQDVGVFRQVGRNLISANAQPEVVRLTEISASAFTLTRIPPLVGRYLLPDDEQPGAPPVLVIGHDVWRKRFAGASSIVGQPLQLGETEYTIVGVMPEGYAFPVNNDLWTPLKVEPSGYERREGPSLTVFARLAPGATLESANTEATAFGLRTAAAFPRTHAQLRPQVLPYTYPYFDVNDPEVLVAAHLVVFLVALLLVIVCVNVAILVYARTATRQGEIAVRTALGASRGRIVGQLFVEALVLAAIAAVLGLAVTTAGLEQVNAAMRQGYPQIPFWWDFRLSAGAVGYAVALTIVAAAIVGVVPALKATGRRVQLRLQTLSGGGGSGMQLGRLWTLLVVAQVAFAVALLPAAIFHAWDSMRLGATDPRFDQVLTTQLVLDRPTGATPGRESPQAFAARYQARYDELARRLMADPAVSHVTFGSNVPGEEATAWIEADGIPSPADTESPGGGTAVRAGSRAGHTIGTTHVDVGFFDAYDVPVLAGRGLERRDTAAASNTVVVNRALAQSVFGEANAIGRRIRYVGTSRDVSDTVPLGAWLDIVGVVADFPTHGIDTSLSRARVYHAATAADIAGVTMSVRVRATTPGAFTGRLREIAAAVDPNLQLRQPASLGEVLGRDLAMLRVVAAVLMGLTAAVLLLSAAGIYAMMSFTVSQRRREIGIRAALGADPRRLLGSIFSRAAIQLGTGALLGMLAAAVLETASGGELMRGNGLVILPIVTVFMMCAGLLAALGPARRGLRIHPTEALREQ
jgi:predicted permease